MERERQKKVVELKFFIDTANIDEIRKAKELGILDGVTTNPTLVAREQRDFKEIVQDIASLTDAPVSVEVIATDVDGIVREARSLAAIAPNFVIKVPITEDGLKAVRVLSGEGIQTNVTLVFSANQALLAAKAGATYVSPFIGRLDDIGHDGMQLVRDIVQMYTNYAFATQVIVASIRHPLHVIEAAKAGAHIATIPPAVISKLIQHPLTDIGLQRFLDDWRRTKQSI